MRTDWRTPPWLFERLNSEFFFDLDAAADASNHLCAKWFDEATNAIGKAWAGRVFMNPPYGKSLPEFVAKAHAESHWNANVVVGVLPASTDQQWFHTDVLGHAEIRFVRGRVRFQIAGGKFTHPRFATLVAVWRGDATHTSLPRTLAAGEMA
jgi:site-specific DNA-methyltransferase (adenine-specific)